MRHVGILSVGSYLPDATRSVDALFSAHIAPKYKVRGDFISRTTGISQKHIAAPHSQPSDLAIAAAKRALVGVHEPIDAIIYAGMTPDYIEPGTGHIIADALGISPSIAKNTPDACHGFAHALHDARLMIGSGEYNNVLICTGEIGSKYEANAVDDLLAATRLDIDEVRERAASFTLGDAGGAVVVSSCADTRLSLGKIYPMALSSANGICRIPTASSPLFVNQPRLKKLVTELLLREYRKFLQESSLHHDKLLYYIVHQTSRTALADFKRFIQSPSASFVDTVHRCGNTISVSFPLQLDRIFDQIRNGDQICAVLIGSGVSASFIELHGTVETKNGNRDSRASRSNHSGVYTSD